MRVEMYRVVLVGQGDIATVRQQATLEEAWADDVEAMYRAYPARAHWAGFALAIVFEDCVRNWPVSLLQRLEWGDMPHFGALGGVSHWRFEALLEHLDYVMAQTVRRTGRTVWTDLAWRRIAMLGTVQRSCPDCEQFGPGGQMAQFGAIFACDLCQGVSW